MGEPHRLIIEVCAAAGTRISEVLGLQRKHYDSACGVIAIERFMRGPYARESGKQR
jgi:integrase